MYLQYSLGTLQYIFSYKDGSLHFFAVLRSESGGFQSLILPLLQLKTLKKEDYVVQCRVAGSVIKL